MDGEDRTPLRWNPLPYAWTTPILVDPREVPLIDARIEQVEVQERSRKTFFSLDPEAGTLRRAWRSTS